MERRSNNRIREKVTRNAGHFLGDNNEKQREISELVKRAYKITSKAVHTGTIDSNEFNELDAVGELMKTGILKMIDRGVLVNWKK